MMNANPAKPQGKGPQNGHFASGAIDSLGLSDDSAGKVAAFFPSSQLHFMIAIFPQSARHLVLACLVIALAYSTTLAAATAFAEPPKEQEPAKETVKLVIDYGDGVQKVFASLPWTKEITVFRALEAAAKHPRGIKFTHQGKGETVLVTAIDDLKNEGRGRNWLYEVNGKLGDRSCAVMPLKAGDSVLWRFGKY